MSDPKLEPCPFCGGEPELSGPFDGVADICEISVVCKQCSAVISGHYSPFFPDAYTKKEIVAQCVAAWNRRAPQPATDARVEAQQAENKRLREALWDLSSWFDAGPSQYGPWIITRAADDAVEAARDALREGGTP